MEIFSHEYFMKEAIKEARVALDQGEVPIGAIVVANKRIIAKGHNGIEKLKDATAHAEMVAITSAMSAIGAKYLNGCSLYVTLEPCIMCAGALGWSKLDKLIFGARDLNNGYQKGSVALHPKTTVVQGIMEAECQELLNDFFKSKRS